jgi:hypothetical protein
MDATFQVARVGVFSTMPKAEVSPRLMIIARVSRCT